MMTWLDHVILGVQDLESGANRVEIEFGLVCKPGGVFPDGVANRIMPFGDDSYLELLGVQDKANPGGSWLAALVEKGDAFVGWAIGTDSIDELARRTGYALTDGSIELANGKLATWRTLSHPGADQWKGALPFFIEYAPGLRTQEAERARVEQRRGADGIRWVEVGVDDQTLLGWLGDHKLDIRCVSGNPGLHAVGILVGDREVVLRYGDVRL